MNRSLEMARDRMGKENGKMYHNQVHCHVALVYHIYLMRMKSGMLSTEHSTRRFGSD